LVDTKKYCLVIAYNAFLMLKCLITCSGQLISLASLLL
jgi:hypothetical protein